MVVDSSALIAILAGEPERRRFIDAIVAADVCMAGAPTMLETSMVVLARAGEGRLGDLRELCTIGGIRIVPFAAEQVDMAVDAFRRYGKGRHPAALNFGDCMSYALAKSTAEKLLFKGNDFARTDIDPAL